MNCGLFVYWPGFNFVNTSGFSKKTLSNFVFVEDVHWWGATNDYDKN